MARANTMRKMEIEEVDYWQKYFNVKLAKWRGYDIVACVLDYSQILLSTLDEKKNYEATPNCYQNTV